MERNLKVCLVIGGVAVFVIGLVIVGSGTIIYLNRDKLSDSFDNWMEGMDEHRQQGEEFGTTVDEQGCLDEALSRTDGKGTSTAIAAGVFMRGCFESAQATEGFCDEAPSESEILATVTWSQQRCATLGRVNDQACISVMQIMQNYCNAKRAE